MNFISGKWLTSLAILATATMASTYAVADSGNKVNGPIRHVLLISIDGMHALDLENCTKGVSGLTPYCPNLAALAQNGLRYTQASSAKPSDSFPGLLAMLTGGSPRSTGVFYDNSFDRSLAPPQNPTNGINNGQTGVNCNVGKAGPGTEVLFDESIDIDLTLLDGGGGINTENLPRDPFNNCQPVFPHQYLRVNTIFEVVKKAGGYTAWSDKNWGYDIVQGRSGKGVDDLFIAEIKSNIVPLPGIPGCTSVPDPTVSSDWTTSFDDIKCYDALKVQAVINEIDGKTHDGSQRAPVPTIFGMNFQAMSVGQKLVEATTNTTGGYKDALGTPSDALLGEIKFVDQSIGAMVRELDEQGLLRSTVVIVSAKHGQSPINPNSNHNIGDTITPALGNIEVLQATEDDVALLWLEDQGQASAAAAAISAAASTTALGEIFVGNAITQLFNDPLKDPRTPDLIVSPNVGIIYTTSKKKQAEHGGFNHDDTNVALLVYNPALTGATLTNPVNTAQIAPTILAVLGLEPSRLQAVQNEETQLLPGLFEENH